MDYQSLLNESSLLLLPALYIIGMIIKGIEKIPDKFIPIILLPFGVVGSMALQGLTVQSAIQGVLVTGTTVYANQLIKQANK